MKKVFIISYAGDPHAEVVCEHLKTEGVDFFYFETNNIVSNYMLKLSFPKQECKIFNLQTNLEMTLDKAWTIWNRRIIFSELNGEKDEQSLRIIEGELKRTLEGMMFFHEGKVINDPRRNYQAQNKLQQLNIATKSKQGVYIPETIVSNSHDDIISFYNLHKGEICFKLQRGAVIRRNGKQYCIMTNKVIYYNYPISKYIAKELAK